MEQEKTIELRSKEIQEIIGRIPHWIIRSGNTMICLLVILLLTGSWIFKYVDTIQAQIIIVIENPIVQENNRDKSEKIIGRLSIPSANIARVRPGQLVHIKFDRYPYTEFGMTSGIIRSISSIPEDDNYSAVVDLPNGLITNDGKELKLGLGLTGIGEIIIEELRLLERISQPITSFSKKHHSF